MQTAYSPPPTTLLELCEEEAGIERKSHLCITSSGESGEKDPAAFSSVSMSAEVLTGVGLRKSDGE